MVLFASRFTIYVIIIVSVIALCVICYLIRRKLKIGTYTKEEEAQMKSNLDMLIQTEKIEEGKDYHDEV